MKRVGIIGGMSYESTDHYYKEINRGVNEQAGGMTSADLVVRSVNFEEYKKWMDNGDWPKIEANLKREALNLVTYGGCRYVAIATNTMHKVANGIRTCLTSQACSDTFVHIGDGIADECKEINAKRILLLGTKFTMTEDFMKDYLLKYHNIESVDTSGYTNDIERINQIIFEELCHGEVYSASKKFLIDFTDYLVKSADSKPDAIVLGCTELCMAIRPGSCLVPVIDSAQAHIDKLIKLSLS